VRIVFLDFDGVLNSRPWLARPSDPGDAGALLDADAVARVDRLCALGGAEIVISSSWRVTHTLPVLTALLRQKGLIHPEILDATPMIPHKRGRGQEIQAWLDAALAARGLAIEGMAILDDQTDLLHLMPWLVETPFEPGFTDSHLPLALEILGREMPPR